jgi:hypothetical protein
LASAAEPSRSGNNLVFARQWTIKVVIGDGLFFEMVRAAMRVA